MKRYLPFVIIALVFVVAIVGGTWLLRAPQRPERPGNSNAQQTAANTQGADPPRIRGEANAPVTIEEFGDFQCPPCAATHPLLKTIEAQYGSRLRVIFRNFPLRNLHPHALNAARAAEAAGLQGKYWEMHDMIYENQATWTTAERPQDIFTSYARALNLDLDRFSNDVRSGEVMERIRNDFARGESLGVTGTPTLFLNGRELRSEEVTTAGLTAAIDAALRASGQPQR